MTKFAEVLRKVHEREPRVQCITNFVTVNDCANIILAAGGTPSMADHIDEVAEALSCVQALVCNMGAIALTDSMIVGGKEANRRKIPVVLDPVAVGGTQLRRDAAKRLLEEVHFTAIRGNASEIRYLAGQQTTGAGVDVSDLDAITEENLPEAQEMIKNLAKSLGTVIAVSGVIDLVSDGERTMVLRNGCATMSRITGSGCMLTSMIGAFVGAAAEDPFTATCAAMAAMGIAGEIAEKKRIKNGTGNATFRTDLIDAVFNLTEEELTKGARYEIF